MNEQVTYCGSFRFWMRVKDPLTEDQARERFDRGKVFTVVLGDPVRPRCFLEVNTAQRNYVGVNLLDGGLRITATLDFSQRADPTREFLGGATFSSYQGHSETPWDAMTYTYFPDGVINVRYDGPEPMDLKVGRTTGDVGDHWEEPLVFGRWEPFARTDRRIARPPMPEKHNNAQQAYDEQRQINARIRAEIRAVKKARKRPG